MFEVDSALEPFEVDTLEGWLLLDLLQDDTDARARADRKRLLLAERFVELTRVEVGSGREHAGWDEEGLVEAPGFVDTLGGEGTPLVGIEAPVQWAAHSGRSLVSAKHYLANTMDLQHRLPLTRARVGELEVSVWTAFQLAKDTRSLSWECARWIDARLAETGHYGQKTRDLWVKAGIARFHPDRMSDTSRLGREDWDVRVDHNPNGSPGGGTGTSTLEAVGDSVDLAKFLDAVCDEAATAGRLGDTDPLGQRKAKALGTIADRQATLDLAGLLDPPTQEHADQGPRPSVNAAGDLIHPVTGRVVQRKRSYGKVRIFIHLTQADLDAHFAGDTTRVADTGRLGPQTVAKITEWLRAFGPDAKITPVIDTTREWAVDQHDPPEAMRDQILQRDRHCVFPECTVDSRHCDLDHIDAYDEHGPPGQTDPAKLAPLCRRHHLVKTHCGWTYVRNHDGTYTWVSPFGRVWLVTPEGTIDATDP